MTRTWNGRVRPIAGLAATTLTILTLFSGAGSALALQTTSSGSNTTSTSQSGEPDHSDGNASTRGSSEEPQPESTADQNSGGANGQCPDGPYCSTRDGSASMNGSETGKATGKPCAGCVGKADNKNPKGQNPDGSDNNAGYECDDNQGVGQSNPAHTGCQSTAASAPGAQSCSTDDSMSTDKSTSEQDSRSTDESTSGDDSQSTDESTSGDDSQSADESTSGDDEGCTQCPTDQSMSNGDQTCDGAAARLRAGTPGPTVAGTSATRPAAVLGAEAFRTPAQGAQAKDGRSAVVAAAAALLPDALLPNTGAGAALLLLLLVGAAMLLVGTCVLVARRRTARI